MATITDGRYWLAALLTLTLVATTLVLPEAEAEEALQIHRTTYATASGAESLVISVPEATAPGDLLVAVVAVNGSLASLPDQDWTLVRSDSRAGELTQALWTRRATDDEPRIHTWSGGNRRTNQVGAIVAVDGGDDLVELRLLDAGAPAHRREPLVIPGLHAERDGAVLFGAYSLDGTGDLVASDGMMDTQESHSGAITLATAFETVGAGTTGDRIIKREVSGGAVGQLLLIEKIAAKSVPDQEQSPDETLDEDDHAAPDGQSDIEVDDSGSNESSDIDTDLSDDDQQGHGSHSDPDGDDHESDAAGKDEQTLRRWLDPATWPDGTVPSSQSDVVIDGHIVLDGNASARTVTVTPGSTLEFATDTSAQLQAFGNVVVEGALRMQPTGSDIDHALRFFGVDEETYVGGGHDVLETDTGLWFTGNGHAELAGTHRLPWTRAARSLTAGSTTLELEDDPDGWQVGDEVVITPTSAPGTPNFSDGYSEGRIRSVDGRSITLDTPLAFDHPRVNDEWGAEVMNMTRNVRIEGTPEGRAHILFSHASTAQHLRNVELRYLGPRQETDATYRSGGRDIPITEGVLGRYPLHFHHNGPGSFGSVVENVVVRDSGHRAFVAHASDGITFRGTIAHDVFDTPYWWDRRTGCCGRNAVWDPGSNDITYERAVASLVRVDPPFRGYRLAGFELGHGSDMTVKDSVAVGVKGNKHAAGFSWPEGTSPEEDDHWTFVNNVAHNNRTNGIFVWQNTGDTRHVIRDSQMYHNGQDGIDHGAYSNRYSYTGLTLYGNGHSATRLHAQGEMRFVGITFDGAGVSKYGFRTTRHRSTNGPAVLRDGRFSGYTTAGIAFLASEPTRLDIIDPSFDGSEDGWFFLADHVSVDSEIRVQLQDGTAFRLHPASSERGTLVPEWNGRREAISPFG